MAADHAAKVSKSSLLQAFLKDVQLPLCPQGDWGSLPVDFSTKETFHLAERTHVASKLTSLSTLLHQISITLSTWHA